MTSAKVIADSVTATGSRVTTMEVECHRFVLAEFNTHRVFSRNSASSRAIPLKKQIQRIVDNPAIPVSFPAEKPGMSGGEELPPAERGIAVKLWMEAAQNAINLAIRMGEMGVHKSVVNRILEPFMWHKIIVTSVEWDNFFEQRCSPLAQPEIREAAEAMRLALEESVPQRLQANEWHLPYIDDATTSEVLDRSGFIGSVDSPRDYPWHGLKMISAARCARVSYLTHDGTRDLDKDIELYRKLVGAQPAHWSPLEHVVRPIGFSEKQVGNLPGFVQLRHAVTA